MEPGSTIWFQQDNFRFLMEDGNSWHRLKTFTRQWRRRSCLKCSSAVLLLLPWAPRGKGAVGLGEIARPEPGWQFWLLWAAVIWLWWDKIIIYLHLACGKVGIWFPSAFPVLGSGTCIRTGPAWAVWAERCSSGGTIYPQQERGCADL